MKYLIIAMLFLFSIAAFPSASKEAADKEIVKDEIKNTKNKSVHKTVKTLDIEKGVLTVLNRNGSVSIEEWNKKYIEIEISKSSDNEEDLSHADVSIKTKDKIVISGLFEKGEFTELSIELNIKVPSGIRIDTIITTNGSIKLIGTKSSPYLKLANGSIRAERVGGKIIAEAINGRIDLSNVNSIEYAKTINGGIKADVREMKHDMILETTNGSIDIFLDGKIKTNFEFTTQNGKITSSGFQLSTEENEKTFFKGKQTNYSKGSIGKSDYKITAQAVNGSIKLSKK